MVAYSFNKRFVDPIKCGLGLQFDSPELPADLVTPKRQTIRAIGKRRHARPGETLQLYHGMRTTSCFKIGEARCAAVQDIVIAFGTRRDVIKIFGEKIMIELDDRERLNTFAMSDGFSSWDDMKAFWAKEHPGITDFSGVLIKW